MPFNQVPRVRFSVNPIVDVTTQLTFATPISALDDAHNIINVHNALKDRLPLFKRIKTVSLDVNPETQSVTRIEKPLYELASIDEDVKITINSESLSCVTTNYQTREEFFSFVQDAYSAIREINSSITFKRVGLRYKDLIKKSALAPELQSRTWGELLRAPLVAALIDDVLSQTQILDVRSSFHINLNTPLENSKLQASYGLVNHSETREQGFLIDSDFYTEGVFGYEDAMDFLGKANIKARAFFRWCIQDELYNAFGPELISEE